ncbi:MAG TPA: methyltransferase domain-containing protein [Myxococcaceae bacterium]|nr:methyltransferase domain-containing protein [Myxococcaceae bacterium]
MSLNTNRWNEVRYTLLAPLYDPVVSLLRRPRRRSLELLDVQPGERVLLLGAGTGEDLPFLPAEASVSAIDITPAMVARIQRKARRLGREVDARVMDGQALSYPDGSFDAVILHLVLAVIPDPIACIKEVERVLKPGGRAVVLDKFVPDGRGTGLGRRLLNVATNAVFSDITRQLGPIVSATGLTLTRRLPAAFGGAFEMALLRK